MQPSPLRSPKRSLALSLSLSLAHNVWCACVCECKVWLLVRLDRPILLGRVASAVVGILRKVPTWFQRPLKRTLKSGLTDSALSRLIIAAESAQLANFVATTFCSIPLTVSNIPTTFHAFNVEEQVVDYRFCQVRTPKACTNWFAQGILTL
jgi:ABC-type sulfate transport system permease component